MDKVCGDEATSRVVDEAAEVTQEWSRYSEEERQQILADLEPMAQASGYESSEQMIASFARVLEATFSPVRPKDAPRAFHLTFRVPGFVLQPGQPCGHPGCLSHRTHPCEGCGRIGGEYPVEEDE